MRIALVNTRADVVGGSQVHVRDLGRALLAQGHHVHVFLGGQGPGVDILRDANVPFRQLRHLIHPIRPITDACAVRELRDALADFAPDLISTHTSKAGVVGRSAARLLGIPALFTAHGWNFTDGIAAGKQRFRTAIERKFARWSDRIITVSEYDRQLALRRGIASPEKLITVHNGLPDISPALRADAARQPPRIVMVARFEQQKDHVTLFHALATLRHLDWHLELVGGGPLEAAARQLAADLGLAERVDFLGPRNDVAQRLAGAQIYTLISLWEGLPRSIIEAMRAGLPVIASNVGGVAELIDESRTGHLIARQDSTQLAGRLASLLRDPDLRTAMGTAGRAKYKRQFTFQRMLEATQNVYNQILHDRRSTSDSARHPRSRRHRVVHVVESFGAGTAEVISDLTRGIPEFDHVVICGHRSDSALAARRLHPDVKLLPWNGAGREIHPLKDTVAFFDVLRHLRRLRVSGGVDVLHAHSAKGGAHGRAAAAILGLIGRTIYTTHASPVLRQDVGPWTHRLYVALERLGWKLGGKLVACSHSELAHLTTVGLAGQVIPNGFEPPTPHRPRSRAAERTVSNQSLQICTAGRITSQKDPELFARIARESATDSAAPIQFTWIGSGELSTELSRSDVRITGWLDQPAVTRELEHADVYLSTSRWEGLSLGVLRAMALAKPLVLRRCIGNTDVVSHGANGFLFDSAAEAAGFINLLAKDPALRRTMGERSLRLVETSFSRQQMLDSYRRLYNRTCATRYIPQRSRLPHERLCLA